MNAELKTLKKLQVLDAEIATLAAEIASQPKLVAAIDARLNEARKRVEQARLAIDENASNRARLEQEARSFNDKIIKFREQSSAVKTNEQYKALLSEIAAAETQVKGSEDQVLDLEMAVDTLNKSLEEAEAALKAGSEVIEKETSVLNARIEQTAQQMAVLQKQSATLKASLDENLMLHYERVLRKRGTAVAAAQNQRCMGCMVSLRPQVYARLQEGKEIIFCDSCARILYYDGDKEEEAAQAIGNSVIVEREWVYLPSMGENGAFVAFSSAKGTASLRAYDAVTGALVSHRSVKGKTFRQAFADEVGQGRTIFVHDTTTEDKHKTKLPPEIVQEMRRQLPDTSAA